jgi:hypothetical protein
MYNWETKVIKIFSLDHNNDLTKTSFYEEENLQGVFFKVNSNGNITDEKLSITFHGETYTSTHLVLVDSYSNSLTTDDEEFFIYKNEEPIVINSRSTNISDRVYKIDIESVKIFCFE